MPLRATGVVCLAAVRGRRYLRLQLGDTEARFHIHQYVPGNDDLLLCVHSHSCGRQKSLGISFRNGRLFIHKLII
jgi:hypothetical protein